MKLSWTYCYSPNRQDYQCYRVPCCREDNGRDDVPTQGHSSPPQTSQIHTKIHQLLRNPIKQLYLLKHLVRKKLWGNKVNHKAARRDLSSCWLLMFGDLAQSERLCHYLYFSCIYNHLYKYLVFEDRHFKSKTKHWLRPYSQIF